MGAPDNSFTKLTAGYDESLHRNGISGRRNAERLSVLSEIGQTEEGGVTRPRFSAEEKQAKETMKR